jgi:predicted Zn finger-like uncharacterized protein
MNNTCPSCGAVYNVAGKDVGRRIKCKKCGTALTVTEAGLEVDAEAAPAPAPSFPAVDDRYDEEESPSRDRDRGRKDRGRSRGGPGFDLGQALKAIGGLSTILFGIGAFLVIVFFFQPYISTAAVKRASGGTERFEQEQVLKLRTLEPDKDKIDDERVKIKEEEAALDEENAKALATEENQKKYAEAKKGFRTREKDLFKQEKDLEKRKNNIIREMRPKSYEAHDNEASAKINAKRSEWLEQYGLMFGFAFLALGCIGYVRSDAHLVVRIVGGTILVLVMMAIFNKFSGCQGGMSIPKAINGG